MQITLVQTEIEAALRQYIGRKFTVANGVQMKIDLAATRGAEGFKATIDVLEEAQPLTSATRPTLVPRSAPAAAATSYDEVITEKVVEPLEETADLQEEPAQPDYSPETATTGEPDTGNEAHSTETEPVSAQPKVNTRGRSLFQGLSKPKSA